MLIEAEKGVMIIRRNDAPKKKLKYGGEMQRLSKWAALSGAKNLKYILWQEK